ncbi:hypothetical protein AKJ40_04165 [candidate division MSBL1 archaeon SCGC-AAA259M10]|uniref:Uncharacterized protein n=1 Tax=candidate division MSBL1 archaeon SCGC-AAA259M10 TaxID=1698270 RepID=A0A133UXU5_9EURY|nr:hypothetical protein AKJ40_04165 [candidate division MSBL1 archaeon SCGC-AAA259M10]
MLRNNYSSGCIYFAKGLKLISLVAKKNRGKLKINNCPNCGRVVVHCPKCGDRHPITLVIKRKGVYELQGEDCHLDIDSHTWEEIETKFKKRSKSLENFPKIVEEKL